MGAGGSGGGGDGDDWDGDRGSESSDGSDGGQDRERDSAAGRVEAKGKVIYTGTYVGPGIVDSTCALSSAISEDAMRRSRSRFTCWIKK